MGGGGGGTTTVQKADPWEKQMPYLSGGMNEFETLVPGVFPEAAKLYESGQLAPDYYKGNTVTNQSAWTQKANQMQADRALNGDASISTYKGSMDNIASGNALASNTGLNALNQMTTAVNPYSSALLNDAIGEANAKIDSGFSGAGRYGSGAHENAKADSVADLTSQFYSDAYDKQMEAAGMAGDLYNAGIDTQISAAQQGQELANQAYTDAEMLSQAGANLDAYNQAKLDANIDRWNYDQQKALTALSNYNQLIQGTYGGTTTQTGKSGYAPSALGTAVGGAALAGGILESADIDWASLFS